jgi:uncharacterized protein (DUF1501 family)
MTVSMSGSISRRHLLQGMGAAALSMTAAPVPWLWDRSLLHAAETGRSNQERILVLIQLAGGNDGLNTVIPFADDLYYRARPGLGIGRSAVLKLDDHFGLHPNLSELQAVWDTGELAIIQGIGYPQPDRSHFRSMDIWQSAQPEELAPRTGWLGRALDLQAEQQRAIEAMSLGGGSLPLALTAHRVLVPTVSELSQFRRSERGWTADAAQRDQLVSAALNRPASTQPAGKAEKAAVAPSVVEEHEFARQAFQSALRTAERLRQLPSNPELLPGFPPSELGRQLSLVTRFITADLPTRVYFLSLDGFDTHAQQLPGHAALLQELSSAVGAFLARLKEHSLHERVLVATYSEFGRRVAENGSLGTDHGAASVSFLAGGRCRGGLHGKFPSLVDLDDGDLRWTVDFRRLYAELLTRWLEIPSEPILGPGFEPLNVTHV